MEGAVTGVAIAAVLNSATTRTHMETAVQLEMTEGEAFFHYGLASPERLRIELSAVFGRLRRRTSHQVSQPHVLITEQLGKLADLRREGLMSEEEYAVAKQRLLSE